MADKIKKEKKKRLPNAPTKPLSTYLEFLRLQRISQKEALAGKNISDQREILNKLWKEIDSKEKEKLEIDYKNKMVTYKEELEKYKNSDLYVQDCKLVGRKPKNSKKRPKTAYNLFVSENFKNMEGTFAECTASLSKKWKEMSDSEKKKYNLMAESEKNKFSEQEE